MRSQIFPFILALTFLHPSSSVAQQTHASNLWARLSYSNTLMRLGDVRARNVCFSVDQDGSYRLLRSGPVHEGGGESADLWSAWQGILSSQQLIQLRQILDGLTLRRNPDGVVLNGAEFLSAEIVRDKETVHYTWANPDNRFAFSGAVKELTQWLQTLDVSRARLVPHYELSNTPICPPARVKAIPSLAQLEDASRGDRTR